MNANDAIDKLKAHYPNAAFIDAANQGNKFETLIVDDGFSGKRLVQRQQEVYAVFKDEIAKGVIHALSIHALTQEEYAARNNPN